MMMCLRVMIAICLTCGLSAMRVVSPPMAAAFYSADVVLALEFLPGIDPSLEHPLWCRFFTTEIDVDGNEANKLLVFSSEFTNFGSYGDASELVFSHAFALPPGTYTLEIRLGVSWDQPLSASLAKHISFTLLELDDVGGEANNHVGGGGGDSTRSPTTSSTTTMAAAAAAAAVSQTTTTKVERGLAAVNPPLGLSPTHRRGNDPGVVVVDAFPFFNEFEVLVLRLLELGDVVDVFVLVESRSTHSGKMKPLYYADYFRQRLRNDPVLAPLEAKVFAVVDDQEPISPETKETEKEKEEGFRDGRSGSERGSGGSNRRGGNTDQSEGFAVMLRREVRQRDFIAVALSALSRSEEETLKDAETTNQTRKAAHPLVGPQSLVLVSDVDEVPRKSTVLALKNQWQRALVAKEEEAAAGATAETTMGNATKGAEARRGRKSKLVAPVRLLMEWYLYSLDWASRRAWGLFGTEGPYAIPAHMLLLPTPPPVAAAAAAASTAPSSFSPTQGTASQWRRALRVHEARQLLTTPTAASLPSAAEAAAASTSTSTLPAVPAAAIGVKYVAKESPVAVGLGVWSTICDAGWHFSSFGGVDAVRAKLGAYIGAAQYDSDVFRDEKRLQRLLRHGVAYFELAALGTLKSLPEDHADHATDDDDENANNYDSCGDDDNDDDEQKNTDSDKESNNENLLQQPLTKTALSTKRKTETTRATNASKGRQVLSWRRTGSAANDGGDGGATSARQQQQRMRCTKRKQGQDPNAGKNVGAIGAAKLKFGGGEGTREEIGGRSSSSSSSTAVGGGGDIFAGFERTPPRVVVVLPSSTSPLSRKTTTFNPPTSSASDRFEASLPLAAAYARRRQQKSRQRELQQQRQKQHQQQDLFQAVNFEEEKLKLEEGEERGGNEEKGGARVEAALVPLSASIEASLVRVFGGVVSVAPDYIGGSDGGEINVLGDCVEGRCSGSGGGDIYGIGTAEEGERKMLERGAIDAGDGFVVEDNDANNVSTVNNERELFLLNQDIRRAKQHSTDTAQFVVDAFSAGDPTQRLRTLTRHPLVVLDCRLAREPSTSVERYCATHAFPSPSCEDVRKHAESACEEVRNSHSCKQAAKQTDTAAAARQTRTAAAESNDSKDISKKIDNTDNTMTNECAYRGMFELDLNRRFEVVVAEDTFLVEVAPWDDEALVAEREGRGMGLQVHEILALETHLRDCLKGDAVFQEHRQRTLDALGEP